MEFLELYVLGYFIKIKVFVKMKLEEEPQLPF